MVVREIDLAVSGRAYYYEGPWPTMCILVIIAVLALSATSANGSGAPLVGASEPAVYVWQQSVKGDWQAASSWTPARSTPAPSDILMFNGGGMTTATNLSSETIGQLIVSGSTTVNLQSGGTSVLTVGGSDGDDLVVGAGSGLNFSGSNAISCSLTTGATAVIDGLINFSSSGAASHRLTAIDSGAVVFETGSV